MSPSSKPTQWSAVFTVLFIIFLGSIDPSSGRNCNDGTTEALNRCRALVNSGLTQRPAKFPMNEGCILPDIPNSRIVYESDRNDVLTSGETVPHLFVIFYKCASGYLHVGSKYNLCYNGEWYSEAHPICVTPCPNADIRGRRIEADCERDGLTVSCNDPILPGTVARIKCHNRYKKKVDKFGSDTLVCQTDGKWNNKKIDCGPVCGELVTSATPFIKNGEITNVTFVPWHAAIYRKVSGNYVYHCGGTILSELSIISGSSCFLKPNKEVIEDKSQFLVGAGKHLGDYNANDPKAQFRTVVDLVIFHGYAYVWLKDRLVFTLLIGPVCMDVMPLDTTSQSGNLVNYGREETNVNITRDTRLIPLSHGNRLIDCASIKVNDTCATDQCVRTLCRNFLGSGFTVEVNKNGISKHTLVGVADVTQKKITVMEIT